MSPLALHRRARGFITPSGGSAWARPVQVSRSDPARSESYIAVTATCPSRRKPDRPFNIRVLEADAGPLISLITAYPAQTVNSSGN